MTDLVGLMDRSTSIIDLEEKLKEEGHNFDSYKSYFRFLKDEWYRVSSSKINKILASPATENKLSTVAVESAGIEYLLHGIVHGEPMIIAPGWYPRKNVREFISNTMHSFCKYGKGEDYLYEQNFGQFFDLSESRELEDHITNTSKSLIKDLGLITLSIPFAMIGLIALPIIFGGSYIYTKCVRNKSQSPICIAQKALSDEKYQSKFADLWFACELPQPFDLESKYVFNKEKSLFKWLSFNQSIATSEERSLWTAEKLRECVYRRDLKKLHYLGGMGHITEIAYFLEHPDYSFERLEEWRKNK